MEKIPQLGHHVEICFSVENLKASIKFYENLGFKVYTGGPDKGWCSMTDNLVYIALFPDKFIEKEFGVPFLINYRGGNMDKIISYLKSKNCDLEKENLLGNGLGDAITVDPNGVKLYFDTSKDEERIDVPDE